MISLPDTAFKENYMFYIWVFSIFCVTSITAFQCLPYPLPAFCLCGS